MNTYNLNILSLNYEVSPDDAIVETPSLVTPILVKKRSLRSDETTTTTTTTATNVETEENQLTNNHLEHDKNTASAELNGAGDDNGQDDDDIQIIKIIKKNSTEDHDEDDHVQQDIPGTDLHKSSSSKKLDEYIRTTTIASLTKTSNSTNDKPILTINDYFNSSPGQLLIGLGLSRVVEVTLEYEAKRITRKIKSSYGDSKKLTDDLENINNKLAVSRASNKPYKSDSEFKCPHCPFKSDLAIVMSGHLEVPHQDKKKLYLCSWCDYKIRDPSLIISHCFSEHKKRCFIENPIGNHACGYCPFETNSKRKLQSHQIICEQTFPINTFLSPIEDDLEYPAITSKLIFKEDILAYERTLNDIRLASYNPNIFKVPGSHESANGYQPVFVVPGKVLPVTSHGNRNSLSFSNHNARTVANLSSNAKTTNSNNDNQSALMSLLADRNIANPRFAILQYPQNLPSSFTNGRLATETIPSVLMRHHAPNPKKARKDAGDPPIPVDSDESGSSGSLNMPKNSTFVICEICDCYIRDLSQLKSHMQLSHKVKLHQRTLESRPPLNCQKCQWRFFTDQGLERHLLGAHGLVTSNMQEQIDKDDDSGRCTVCGQAFASKLVAHMKEVHKSNLKPAHLSYKCTVCAATFNLYRLFENHVYSVHSDSIRRVNKVI